MVASLEWRLTGGAGNADPDASLGGVMSSAEVLDDENGGTTLNNLFDNVDPDEALAGDVEYRALDLYNAGDEDAEGVELWISTPSTSADTAITIGKDSTTQTVATEANAPSGVSFSAPAVGSKMSIGTIASGAAQRLWFKRTVTAAAGNIAEDEVGISVLYA